MVITFKEPTEMILENRMAYSRAGLIQVKAACMKNCLRNSPMSASHCCSPFSSSPVVAIASMDE